MFPEGRLPALIPFPAEQGLVPVTFSLTVEECIRFASEGDNKNFHNFFWAVCSYFISTIEANS